MSGRLVRWLLSLAHVRRGGARLTILRHHRVYAGDERPLYRLGVSADVLDAQLAFLSARGLRTVTVAEGLANLPSRDAAHQVALTFDDGYADNVHLALPLLERHGCRATFYLTSGLMETRRAPWWDVLSHALTASRRGRLELKHGDLALDLPLGSTPERRVALSRLLPWMRVPLAEQAMRLAALRAALGVDSEAPCELATWEEARAFGAARMEVGAHTLDHPFLSLHDADQQLAQIGGSVEQIAARLGARCEGLAYPGGDHDANSIEAARRAGLGYAVTTLAGDVLPGAAPYQLARRALPEAACLSPRGRFSSRMTQAELDGAFDRMRGVEAAAS